MVNRVITCNNYLHPVSPFDQLLFSSSIFSKCFPPQKQTAKEIALCALAPSARQSGINPALNKSNPVRCHLCWMLFYAWLCRPRWRGGKELRPRSSASSWPRCVSAVLASLPPSNTSFPPSPPSLPHLLPPAPSFIFLLPVFPSFSYQKLLLFRSLCTGRRSPIYSA